MPILVLLRHGQSQWNLENKFTGCVDVPLTELGEQEARQAGQRLKGIKFNIGFTSNLQRTWKSMEIILEQIGQANLPVFREAALSERHYGDLQGLDKIEASRKYGVRQVEIWRRSYDVAPPGVGGESLKDTAARTIPFFQNRIVPCLMENKNVLVVAHGNSLRSIVMHLENLTKEKVKELDFETGIPRVYEMDARLEILSVKDLK